jgi:flagellum-specific ATP synthase
MLSRRLADAAHYPAIDLSGSISRAMPRLLNAEELERSNRFRRLWTLYQQNQDLIQVGAYEAGTNKELDQAIKLRPAMENFLRQDALTPASFAESRVGLKRVLG